MFYLWNCNGVGRLICLLVTYLVTFGLGAQLLAIGVFVRSFGIQEELACYFFFSFSFLFIYLFFHIGSFEHGGLFLPG